LLAEGCDIRMKIFLVRHGETEWNRIQRFQGRSDPPLNPRGRLQVRALAAALKDQVYAAIYSSPLLRALETAHIIKSHHPALPIFQHRGLIEMDLGRFEGIEARRWAEEYPDFRRAWEENPAAVQMPGGESLEEVQKRAIASVERISQGHPRDATLLLCSHNFVILTLLCHVAGIPLERFRELKQATAAFSVLGREQEHWVVEVLNERAHLQNIEMEIKR